MMTFYALLRRCAMAVVLVLGAGQMLVAEDIHANAAAEFSGEQGQGGWQYMLWNPGGKLHELTFWDEANRQWKEGDGGVWAGGMHPHSTDWYVVREWTCPASGSVTISGTAALGSDAAGVTLRILNGYDLEHELWTADLDQNQSSDFSVKAKLKKGDVLVFAIVGKGGIRNDATSWSIDINPAP